MRRRLLFSTLAVAVSAVLLLGLPLAIVLGRLELLEQKQTRQQLGRAATMIANELRDRGAAGKPANLQEITRTLPGMAFLIRRHGAPPLRLGPALPLGEALSSSATAGQYTVTVETKVTGETFTNVLLLIAWLASLAVGVAVGLAVLQARRLTTPLIELAEVAERLGSGDSRQLSHRYGMRELDRVADGLDRSALRVADLLAAEREFAMDASHQLRTPLAALSMRLEEMIASANDPDVVREEGAAALAQTERLASVVSQLLGRTVPKQSSEATLTGIDDIVAQQVADWDPAFRRANRKIEVTGTKGLRAVTSAGNLAQVIATLLDNALVHGAGTVTIRTWRTEKSVVVEVRDEGSGVPAKLVPHIFERNVSGRPGGTGLGLALARAMAAAGGGRVELVRPRPAAFAVFLPREPRDGDGGWPAVRGPA